ncbi:MAG: hypothetical protein ABWK05_07740 [Pyrobaculum sp.]
MSQIDPVSIARLPEKQRKETIRGILQGLFTMGEDQAFRALRSVISALAERASDEEYTNWCKTTMEILASYPDEVVKAGLALRAKVVASLDRKLADRDAEIINKVMGLLDDATRRKLMRNLK